MNFIDNFLNSITMYRLVLYYLILLLVVAFIFSIFGILSLNPFSLIFTTLFILTVSYFTNKIFSKVFEAPTNIESVYITALILALIITPIQNLHDLPFLFWASVLSMSSKYILAINKKHIFNPAAIAVTLTSIGSIGSASWWVGTLPMLPFVLLGFLIVKKIRRWDLVFYSFLTSILTVILFSILKGSNLSVILQKAIIDSPLFFFAFVMLTEPLTTPPTKKLQSIYGALVGVLFAPQFHLGSFYATPEMALVIGNIYSFIVSPQYKLILKLKEKIKVGSDMIDFIFTPQQKILYSPGQYMEWTLPHKNPDSRGNRRYFTIASSPTEEDLRLGIKFYPNGSSFKKTMETLDDTTLIVGTQLSGDFTLPENPSQKCVFIAGGIGITPFRSMFKYLIDKKETRPIVLFFANKTVDEIIYADVFNQAQQELGIKTVYTLTDKEAAPSDWQGRIGRIDENMIREEITDYLERMFYLSGPHAMVEAYANTLLSMGVKKNKIKKDFFPGFV